MPEPGRTEAPYWVTTVAEARKDVQELAARKVDIVKIWVDDRNGMYKKLTPELYGAIIDEAHKNGLRVTYQLGAPPRDGGHGGVGHDAGPGHRGRHAQRGRVHETDRWASRSKTLEVAA